MLGQVFASVIFLILAFDRNLAAAQFNYPYSIDEQNFGQCTTPNGRVGSCIFFESCQILYNMFLFQPISDVNRMYLSQSQCGYMHGNVLICCPDPTAVSFVSTSTTVRPTQPVQAHKKSIRLDKSKKLTATKKLPRPGECGQITSSRIYGGNKTKIDEYPWMVLIEYKKPLNLSGHHCGGSLISNRYVVTAAHCVNGIALPSDWKISNVRLGEWDTNSNPDCEYDTLGGRDCAPPHIDVPIEKAIPHPKYDPDSLSQVYDIALLRLKETVTFTDFIQPICLPLNNNFRTATFDNVIMDVAGWGKTESKSSSTIKLKAELTGVPLEKCREVYRPESILLEDIQMCAGGKQGVDSCRGDSGGPLIGLGTTNKGYTYYFLAGIVSFGPAICGLEGWPGVYTRVGHFVDWIQATIQT